MGQWTPNYLDNVLHAKITTLVTGAIQRAALDKSEPNISYENFVKELDTGDSFTTTFVDILVRELAERRTRPTANDRRLIAERTAKNLRLLATPLRIYRERPNRNFPTRRAVNLSDYLSVPPNEMEVEDDDDDDDELDPLDSYADGARLNRDLYDAYYGFWPTRRVFSSSPSPPAEEGSTTMRPPSTIGRYGSWTMSNPSNLRRQSSIRLSSRSRTVDFNDFTSRRRTSIREGRPDGGEGSAESRERDVTRGPRPSTRRFFPFGRSRLHESTGGVGSQDGETQNNENADEGFTYIFEPSVSSAALFPLTSPARSASPEHHEPAQRSAEVSDERARHMPRLRRGTIQAPESMFYHHEMRPGHAPGSPTSDHGENRSISAELTSYPTPGPTEGESS